MLRFGILLAGSVLLFLACNTAESSTLDCPPPPSESPQSIFTPPPADGFDFPVGPPEAKGYYNAQVFGKNDHLGDDWNGTGGGNSDLGDPVFSIGNGIVTFAEDVRGGWGRVLRIAHNVGSWEAPELIESLYGHLDTMLLSEGDTVQRGQQIGAIGNAHGIYFAHLHLEIRDTLGLPIGPGYDSETDGYLHPTAFIRAHRPD